MSKYVYEGELLIEVVEYGWTNIFIDGVDLQEELIRIFSDKSDDGFPTRYKCGPVRLVLEQKDDQE